MDVKGLTYNLRAAVKGRGIYSHSDRFFFLQSCKHFWMEWNDVYGDITYYQSAIRLFHNVATNQNRKSHAFTTLTETSILWKGVFYDFITSIL